MSFSDWIGIWSLIVGVVGAVVGIIGCLNLSKANKIAAKCITNSKITQAETLIVNNGVDTYAVIKIARETTQEELKNIVDNLAATTLDLKELQSVCWFAKKATKNNSVSREAPLMRSFFFCDAACIFVS